MIIDIALQGTKEWQQGRLGIPTASGFDNIITTSGTPSKSRLKYMYQLVAERLTEVKEESYQNSIMQRGIDMEAEARAMYELITGNEVKEVGVCYQDDKKLWGCSPDGLVGADGLVEIKCPTSAIHVSYLLENTLPTAYFQQLQGQLFVTGRKWVDFFSFYPGLKPLLIKVIPNSLFIKQLRIELELFIRELDEVTEKLRRL